MRSIVIILLIQIALTLTSVTYAETITTQRIMQFSNKQVRVWKTIIYPHKPHQLPMHRHEHDRILVALTNGTLKITNHRGKVHYLKLTKGNAYFLEKDPPTETHNDVNITRYPIEVMVIELH